MLLAGGSSRRMGTDKATMSYAGLPLWKRQLKMLKQLSPSRVLLSAKKAKPWFPPGVEIVFDPPDARGPLSGIAAGLRRMKTSHLLVLAVDLPQMTAKHLAKLWAIAGPGVGVIPWQDNRMEPLCAIYPAEAADLAEKTLREENASVKRFGKYLREREQAKIYAVPSRERRLYLNMNTPSDVPAFKSARFQLMIISTQG